MQNPSRIGCGRPAVFVAISALLISLAACEGLVNAPRQVGASDYAYVATADAQDPQARGAVLQYGVASDGSLVPLSAASVPAGAAPTAVVSNPTGHYVYVVNQGDATISQYAAGPGGGLVALSPAVVGISGPRSAVVGHSESVDPTGHFLYVVTDLGADLVAATSIAQYSIGSDGTLTPLVPAYINVPGSASGALAIDPSGRHAYLAGASLASARRAPRGLVSQFSISVDGTLSPLVPATVAATHTVIGVTIAPSGKTGYVLSACVDNGCNGQVTQYTIAAADGALTSTGTNTLTGSRVNPVAMVIDSSGSSAYLLTNLIGVDTNQGVVYQYAIDSTGALLLAPTSVNTASGAVAASTDGRNLYALSANAIGFTSGSSTGGYVNQYAVGHDGPLARGNMTTIVGGLPKAVTFLAVH